CSRCNVRLSPESRGSDSGQCWPRSPSQARVCYTAWPCRGNTCTEFVGADCLRSSPCCEVEVMRRSEALQKEQRNFSGRLDCWPDRYCELLRRSSGRHREDLLSRRTTDDLRRRVSAASRHSASCSRRDSFPRR